MCFTQTFVWHIILACKLCDSIFTNLKFCLVSKLYWFIHTKRTFLPHFLRNRFLGLTMLKITIYEFTYCDTSFNVTVWQLDTSLAIPFHQPAFYSTVSDHSISEPELGCQSRVSFPTQHPLTTSNICCVIFINCIFSENIVKILIKKYILQQWNITLVTAYMLWTHFPKILRDLFI